MKKLSTTYCKELSLQEWAWMLIWFSFPLGIRMASLSLVLGGLVMLYSFIRNPFLPKKESIIYLSVPVLFFAVHALNGFHKWDGVYGKEIEQMLPLVFVPIIFLLSSLSKEKYTQASLVGFTFSVVFAGLIMLAESVIQFFQTGDYHSFIYHQLAEPFHMGAIYFSYLILVALLMIDKLKVLKHNKILSILIPGFLVVMMLLSASKTVLGLGMLLLIAKFYKRVARRFKLKKYAFVVLVLAGTVVLTPIIHRFGQLMDTDLELVSQEKFSYDSPFNGLTLRLVQLRFAYEIMSEEQEWIQGVGISESKHLLNEKYTNSGMYTGTGIDGDNGYLKYNFHNQYAETWVRTGSIGLGLLLVLMMTYIRFYRANHKGAPLVFLFYFAFFITESVLERQVGIILFSLLYSSLIIKDLKIETK